MRLELLRLGQRERLVEQAEQLLGGVALVPLSEDLLSAAETISPGTLATLDALHLVTAVRLAEAGVVAAVMTYDSRLAAGARQHGLTVLSPDVSCLERPDGVG